MRRRLTTGLALLALAAAIPTVVSSAIVVAPGGGTSGTSQNFELVGSSPLFSRGMNAAPTIYDHYVYIGSRTDGSSRCGVGDPRGAADPNSCPHPHAGIQIVDIADPSKPTVVGEIGAPFAAQTGLTTRELRIWPQKKLLLVMTFRCSSSIHSCPPGNDTTFPFDVKFFDLSDPIHPRFISSWVPSSEAGRKIKPHEMYLWVDPKNPDRALLWVSFPTISTSPAVPNMEIVDISKVPSGGSVQELAEGNWNQFFPGTDLPTYGPPGCRPYDCNLAVHSMTPSADGRRTYLAYLAGEFLVLDTSSVVDETAAPARGHERESRGGVINLNDRLLTSPVDRPTFPSPQAHSAVPLPGRPFAFLLDEVYGKFTDPTFGCPWGWIRFLDISSSAHPVPVGEYKIAQDDPSFCGSAGDDQATEQFTSYSSHNPTVLPTLIFDSWHSGGLQAIDVTNPAQPAQAGWYSPTPLPEVATEDPGLGGGPNKVIMWSFPIIRNGLIYVVDIRNGLYVLRYTGKGADQVSKIGFLEGNSNLGDAVALDRPPPP